MSVWLRDNLRNSCRVLSVDCPCGSHLRVSASPRFNSLPLENEFAILRADFDFVVGLKTTFEQLHHEQVKQMFLNRAFEQACAELQIVTFLGQQCFGNAVHIHRELLLSEAFAESL